MSEQITFNHDNKFDIQLSQSLIDTKRLADIFQYRVIRKIELKSEQWQWERTGNICIEYQSDKGKSGLAITEADYWVHELKRDGETLVYLMFPIDRLKALARRAFDPNETKIRKHIGGGDGGRFSNILIPLSEILK